jgi:hypothetical protein
MEEIWRLDFLVFSRRFATTHRTPMMGEIDTNGNPYGVTGASYAAPNLHESDTSNFANEVTGAATDSCSASDVFATPESYCASSDAGAFSIASDDFSSSFCVFDSADSDYSSGDDLFSASWDS